MGGMCIRWGLNWAGCEGEANGNVFGTLYMKKCLGYHNVCSHFCCFQVIFVAVLRSFRDSNNLKVQSFSMNSSIFLDRFLDVCNGSKNL